MCKKRLFSAVDHHNSSNSKFKARLHPLPLRLSFPEPKARGAPSLLSSAPTRRDSSLSLSFARSRGRNCQGKNARGSVPFFDFGVLPSPSSRRAKKECSRSTHVVAAASPAAAAGSFSAPIGAPCRLPLSC